MGFYYWDTEAAIKFVQLCAQLEIWANEQGFFLVRGWAKRNQQVQISIYGYERDTYHEWGRAQDYTLFILNKQGKFVWIKDGNHPAWKKIADKAEELGLKTGRTWDDINHVQLEN